MKKSRTARCISSHSGPSPSPFPGSRHVNGTAAMAPPGGAPWACCCCWPSGAGSCTQPWVGPAASCCVMLCATCANTVRGLRHPSARNALSLAPASAPEACAGRSVVLLDCFAVRGEEGLTATPECGCGWPGLRSVHLHAGLSIAAQHSGAAVCGARPLLRSAQQLLQPQQPLLLVDGVTGARAARVVRACVQTSRAQRHCVGGPAGGAAAHFLGVARLGLGWNALPQSRV